MYMWVVVLIIGLGRFGRERVCFSLGIPRHITGSV